MTQIYAQMQIEPGAEPNQQRQKKKNINGKKGYGKGMIPAAGLAGWQKTCALEKYIFSHSPEQKMADCLQI